MDTYLFILAIRELLAEAVGERDWSLCTWLDRVSQLVRWDWQTGGGIQNVTEPNYIRPEF